MRYVFVPPTALGSVISYHLHALKSTVHPFSSLPSWQVQSEEANVQVLHVAHRTCKFIYITVLHVPINMYITIYHTLYNTLNITVLHVPVNMYITIYHTLYNTLNLDKTVLANL